MLALRASSARMVSQDRVLAMLATTAPWVSMRYRVQPALTRSGVQAESRPARRSLRDTSSWLPTTLRWHVQLGLTTIRMEALVAPSVLLGTIVPLPPIDLLPVSQALFARFKGLLLLRPAPKDSTAMIPKSCLKTALPHLDTTPAPVTTPVCYVLLATAASELLSLKWRFVPPGSTAKPATACALIVPLVTNAPIPQLRHSTVSPATIHNPAQ
jgi:hypothetical protein